jgi:DNA/RNA-binding domain of Phe-tRNA-synthetase-like protein/SAM-dependent methyltransferase
MRDQPGDCSAKALLHSPWPPQDPFPPGPLEWSQLTPYMASDFSNGLPKETNPRDPYRNEIWRPNGFILLDLRSRIEFERGHIAGSCHIPAGELPDRRHEFPPRWRPIILTAESSEEISYALQLFEDSKHRLARPVSQPISEWPLPMEPGPPKILTWEIRPSLQHPFLVQETALAATEAYAGGASRGSAVDLACGSGRNAVYLALLGWDVLAVDILADALEMTQALAERWRVKVKTQKMNLVREDPLEPNRFDLIVVTRYLEHSLFPKLPGALRPGGHLIYDTFTEAQAGKGRPRNPRHWLKRKELQRSFPDLTTIGYAEGSDTAGDEIAVLVAQKPAREIPRADDVKNHVEEAKMSQDPADSNRSSSMIQIKRGPDSEGRIILGAFQMSGVNPQAPQDPIHEEIERQATDLRAVYSSPSEASVLLRPARDLYRAIGIDPTKKRPSSEALFRRLISGKGLYRVNAVVDAANLCSLRMMLSIGLYDVQSIQGPVELRIGATGESYDGIGKGAIHVDGRWTLADTEGAFGNPSADSWRTRITEKTRDILFVAFVPVGYAPEDLNTRLRESAKTLKTFCGGEFQDFQIYR